MHISETSQTSRLLILLHHRATMNAGSGTLPRCVSCQPSGPICSRMAAMSSRDSLPLSMGVPKLAAHPVPPQFEQDHRGRSCHVFTSAAAITSEGVGKNWHC
jgi:hypothetical protein